MPTFIDPLLSALRLRWRRWYTKTLTIATSNKSHQQKRQIKVTSESRHLRNIMENNEEISWCHVLPCHNEVVVVDMLTCNHDIFIFDTLQEASVALDISSKEMLEELKILAQWHIAWWDYPFPKSCPHLHFDRVLYWSMFSLFHVRQTWVGL